MSNVRYTMTEVEKLLLDDVENVSSEDLNKVVNRMEHVIKEAWEMEGLIENCVKEINISLSDSESCVDSGSISDISAICSLQ